MNNDGHAFGSRVPLVSVAARGDSPVTVEKGTAMVSLCLAPSSTSLSELIVRCSFLFFAPNIFEALQNPSRADRLTPAYAWIRFLAQPAEAVSGRAAKPVSHENFLPITVLVLAFKVVATSGKIIEESKCSNFI